MHLCTFPQNVAYSFRAFRGRNLLYLKTFVPTKYTIRLRNSVYHIKTGIRGTKGCTELCIHILDVDQKDLYCLVNIYLFSFLGSTRHNGTNFPLFCNRKVSFFSSSSPSFLYLVLCVSFLRGKHSCSV